MSSKGKTGGKNTGSGRFPGDPVNGKIKIPNGGADIYLDLKGQTCKYMSSPKMKKVGKVLARAKRA